MRGGDIFFSRGYKLTHIRACDRTKQSSRSHRVNCLKLISYSDQAISMNFCESFSAELLKCEWRDFSSGVSDNQIEFVVRE